MNRMSANESWQSASVYDFWKEIALHEHIIQLYDNEGILTDTMMGFVAAAIEADENAVVVATYKHLNALEDRMESYGLHIETLISDHKFIPINVEEIVGAFIVNGQVDEERMNKILVNLPLKAAYNQKKYRMFGEMSSYLFSLGFKEAAIKLESAGNDFCKSIPGSACCVYPKKLFTGLLTEYSLPIYCSHTKIISGSEKQITHVHYGNVMHDHVS
jgi:hypothetical protein